MIIFYAFLPLIVFIPFSIVSNFKKMDNSRTYIVLVSILESFASYLFVMVLFTQSYFPRMILWILAILLCIVSVVFVILLHKDKDENPESQIETFKNNLLIFLKFILPTYIFMTIFRFQPVVLQLLYTALIVLGIFFISNFVRKKINKPFSEFIRDIQYGSRWLWGVYAVVGVLIFYLLFFFPAGSPVPYWLNLDNNIGFFEFGDEDYDVQDYKTKIEFEQEDLDRFIVQLDDSVGDITDYNITEDYIYLYQYKYRSEGYLIVIDRTDYSILAENTLYYPVTEDTTLVMNCYNKNFLVHEGELLLFTKTGIYKVDGLTAEQISVLGDYYCRPYINQDGSLHLVNRIGISEYEFYDYDDGAFTLNTTVTVETSEHYYVYDYKLYLSDSLNFILVEDDTDITPISQVMYNVYFDTYYQELRHGHGLVIDNTFYSIVTGEIDTIDIVIYEDTGNIFTQYEQDPIYYKDPYGRRLTYVIDCKANDSDKLEYLMYVDKGDDEFIFLRTELYSREVSVALPFYTHYGVSYLFVVLIGACFGITNYYNESYTIDIESQAYNKKKDEKSKED